MIVLGVIVAHLIGDYVLQNDFIAQVKTKNLAIALFHGWIQACLLLIVMLMFIQPFNPWMLLLVFVVTMFSHAAIDHWRLVKPIIWAVNQISESHYHYTWKQAKLNNGYGPGTPAWMSTWLMIIIDNTLHLSITFILLFAIGLR